MDLSHHCTSHADLRFVHEAIFPQVLQVPCLRANLHQNAQHLPESVNRSYSMNICGIDTVRDASVHCNDRDLQKSKWVVCFTCVEETLLYRQWRPTSSPWEQETSDRLAAASLVPGGRRAGFPGAENS